MGRMKYAWRKMHNQTDRLEFQLWDTPRHPPTRVIRNIWILGFTFLEGKANYPYIQIKHS